MKIDIGKTASGKTISLPLIMGNRHGLITGSTGTGKTVTLQRLAEEFSAAGVPVFAPDVKGDLSGLAAVEHNEKALARSIGIGTPYRPQSFPVQFWDLFGLDGTPIRTSVQEMGDDLIAGMLGLNETQKGALAIAFNKSADDKQWMLSLDDLRWTLDELVDQQEDVSRKYGHVTTSSVRTIQRTITALERQGGANLFGEPPFQISDMIRHTDDGRGIINLIAADRLMEAPKLYAMFLLWLLRELFRTLPEVGDLDKPKMVFFFDEAHLLFRGMSPALVQEIENLVRLVRSKGVGVFMVTQSPADIPDRVLGQLGSRIQHCLRAYTPKDQKLIRASANAFRENRGVDVRGGITALGVGEAFISLLDADGVPEKVERVMIIPPNAKIGPISDVERDVIVKGSPVYRRYAAGAEAADTEFRNRMRASVGLAPLDTQGEYREGDFLKHIPDFTPPPIQKGPGRIYYLKRIAAWGGVIAALYFGLMAI